MKLYGNVTNPFIYILSFGVKLSKYKILFLLLISGLTKCVNSYLFFA